MDSDVLWLIKVIGIMIVSTILLIGSIALGLAHFSAIGEIAEYEQLNLLVNELGVDARSEDILGKVADWNMKIANAKRYNKISFIQFWVSDKIANLESIVIPKGE